MEPTRLPPRALAHSSEVGAPAAFDAGLHWRPFGTRLHAYDPLETHWHVSDIPWRQHVVISSCWVRQRQGPVSRSKSGAVDAGEDAGGSAGFAQAPIKNTSHATPDAIDFTV